MSSFAEIKRQALVRRIAQLTKEYEAVSAQIGQVLSERDKVILGRQADHIQAEVLAVQLELVDWLDHYSVDTSTLSLQQQLDELKTKIAALQKGSAEGDNPMRLQLKRLGNDQMEVRGLDVPGSGVPRAVVALPFPGLQLPAVLKALDAGAYVEARFRKYRETLIEMGLLMDNRLVANLHKRVGRILFNTLFSDEILTEYQIARRSSKPVICQLQFDPEDVSLAQYPWELLHDGNAFIVALRNGIELTRTIAFATPPTSLTTDLPLRVLYVGPRPVEDFEISSQGQALTSGLERLQLDGLLSVRDLNPPTWEKLEEALFDESFDIIHFDGHGSYARVCPGCGLGHYPSTTQCTNGACGINMDDIPPQGHLYFENTDGARDNVSVDHLVQIVGNSNTRLVVLSACGSGVVKGTSIFNGIAPALIRIGIPAVVAMQASPPDPSSTKFAKRFYKGLTRGMRIPEAANLARRAILRPDPGEPDSWWMPVIYLRSSDDSYGQLFRIEEGVNNG